MKILLFTLLSFIGSTTCTYAALTDFEFTINTANSGSSNSTSFTIPTTGVGYNYSVDWKGDGTQVSTGQTGDATFDYTTPGTYTIHISGTFPSIYFNNAGDAQKMASILQWGTAMNWTSFLNAFSGCSNMVVSATDAPVLTGVGSFNNMFSWCPSLTTGNLGAWDVHTITDMHAMFDGCSSFNDNIGNWTTTAVTDMSDMFFSCSVFNNSVGGWNTTAVNDMSGMFCFASAYNQPFTRSFNTANVYSMKEMFCFASAFNQPLSYFNTANVYNMSAMFYGASTFDQSLGSFNTGNVQDMSNMFSYCPFNQPLTNFNTANVYNMNQMFFYNSEFNQSVGSFNTDNVNDMGYMFNNASAFDQSLSKFNTANVTDMSYMFTSATAFNQNIGNLNIGLVTNMTYMLSFSGISVANYDQTLIGWQASAHQSNITFGSDGLTYCSSSAQHAALATNGWVFNDSYLYASTVPTLMDDQTLVATSNVTCLDADGYQQFIDNLTAPTHKYMAINPNRNTGYSFAVTAANNSPVVANQVKSDAGHNTTALANRMYTVVDAGTDNYASGMTVRIYYDLADTAAAVAALATSSNQVTSQWFKMSGSTHAANVATILANQTASTITGATFLVPSAKGVEGGINFVEFSGITSFSTFGYLAAKTSATLLPVTLANLKGMASGCTANLNWQSTTESNNSYYGIEESGDGSTFAQVAKVNSGNSASGAAYTYAYPLQGGTNYFRLKMVDLDGRFSYSPTVAIAGTGACGTGIKATVSPNPTSDVVNITGLSLGSTATLYDMNGKKAFTLLATATTATINLQAFANGIYLLHIQKADGTVETLKIVKQ